jgi:hypothetical protein
VFAFEGEISSFYLVKNDIIINMEGQIPLVLAAASGLISLALGLYVYLNSSYTVAFSEYQVDRRFWA